MKKNILKVLLACLIAVLIPFSNLHAEDLQGADGLEVVFNGKKLKSNFSTNSLTESVSGLQPGDSITFSIDLQNDYDETMEWWIKNDVIKSFEDKSVANGGAYTYRLTYFDENGDSTDIYNSTTVGGEGDTGNGDQGLHEATNAIKDYIYLDKIDGDGSGRIELFLELDGETQGNNYQDTLADLKISFAVQPKTTTKDKDPTNKKSTNKKAVKTGDNADVLPYLLAMALAGCVLMVIAIIKIRRFRKRDKEEDS